MSRGYKLLCASIFGFVLGKSGPDSLNNLMAFDKWIASV